MSQVFHIHAPVTIHIHGDGTTVGTPTEAALEAAPGTDLFLEKKAKTPADYEDRLGYDDAFLDVNIPAPKVTAERKREMLTGLDRKVLVLPYHHFSAAMNKARRLPMWTAVNVDYAKEMRDQRTRDSYKASWRFDPRVPDRLQIGDADFYKPARTVDRGHVVRREDNVWGATEEEREAANADTFHWTNCTPQHERFNQSGSFKGQWGLLENQIKSEAERTGSRLTIFAGPVLADDDPEALGVQYPLKFWKIVMAMEDGALRAYAFVLDQSPVIDKFGLGLKIKELDFDAFKEQQCSVSFIEEITGVSFDRAIHDADVMTGEEPLEVKRVEDLRRRPR